MPCDLWSVVVLAQPHQGGQGGPAACAAAPDKTTHSSRIPLTAVPSTPRGISLVTWSHDHLSHRVRSATGSPGHGGYPEQASAEPRQPMPSSVRCALCSGPLRPRPARERWAGVRVCCLVARRHADPGHAAAGHTAHAWQRALALLLRLLHFRHCGRPALGWPAPQPVLPGQRLRQVWAPPHPARPSSQPRPGKLHPSARPGPQAIP